MVDGTLETACGCCKKDKPDVACTTSASLSSFAADISVGGAAAVARKEKALVFGEAAAAVGEVSVLALRKENPLSRGAVSVAVAGDVAAAFKKEKALLVLGVGVEVFSCAFPLGAAAVLLGALPLLPFSSNPPNIYFV
jgi:hypothetical protein